MMTSLCLGLALATTPGLTVRVDGEGYLRFVREGRIVYATSASLTCQNSVLGSKGLPLVPAIRIPANAIRLDVDLSGNVVASTNLGKTACGQIVLARFSTPLASESGFLISTTRASLGNPGDGMFGVIRS